jgi:ABC-type multidrug transport system fused ATPase/permease subunit
MLIFVGMVLETFSVGLVVPFLGLLSKDDYQLSLPLVGGLFESYTTEQVLVAAMVAIAVLYAVKSAFLYISTATQKKFIFETSSRLSQKAFEAYLSQPYSFHLEHNSATLIRNVESARSIVVGGLDPFLVLLTDGLVAAGLFGLLLAIEPIGTMAVIALFGGSALLFQKRTQARIATWGSARKFHAGKVLQHLQQGLNGAKDIKVLGREKKFLEDHATHQKLSFDLDRRYVVMQSLPRLFFEAIAVLGLAVLVTVMVSTGKSVGEILPTLGLFAASAFRVMPSVGRLIASFQTIGYNRAFIHSVYEDLQLPIIDVDQKTDRVAFCESIVLRDVSFTYPNAHRNALTEVSIAVRKGEAVGIIGSSGAGKSTLVDLFLGLLDPSSGVVEVDGVDISSNHRGWQQLIGYVPQSIYLIDDTIRKNVAFGLPELEVDDGAVWGALKAAQLDEFVTMLPDGLETIVGERGVRLSGGQRQRIGIARALYHDPEVLVLDEATSSLDTETERGVMDAVRDLLGSKTIIIVAHRVSTVSYCSRVYRMEEGRVVGSGSPDVMTGLGESAQS